MHQMESFRSSLKRPWTLVPQTRLPSLRLQALRDKESHSWGVIADGKRTIRAGRAEAVPDVDEEDINP